MRFLLPFIAVLALVGVFAPLQNAVAQRGRSGASRATNRPARPTPPRHAAGNRTAAARQRAARERLAADRRRGVRRGANAGTPAPEGGVPAPPAPRAKAKGGLPGSVKDLRRGVRAFPEAEMKRRERDFLRKLKARSAGKRDESFTADLRLLAGGEALHLKVAYVRLRTPESVFLHRLSVREVLASGSERVSQRLLIKEVAGKLPEGWMQSGGVTKKFIGNIFLHPVVPGKPLRVIDLLPFRPGRHSLKFVGEGERDGRPVYWFSGEIIGGRRENYDVCFRKFSFLPVHGVGYARGSVSHHAAWSELRTSGGVLNFDKKSMSLGGGDSAVIHLTNRRYNSRLADELFDPAHFFKSFGRHF